MMSRTLDASSRDPWESRDAEFKLASSMQRSIQQGGFFFFFKGQFPAASKGHQRPTEGLY